MSYSVPGTNVGVMDVHKIIVSIDLVKVRACADGGANTLFDNFADEHRDQ